jgi:tRNA U34 5-methylaminomethyl-2-thiouridine-forming methyltransferase MnmC
MTDFFQREIIITGDGSHSLKLKGVDEHYHSTHGAIQESSHVFVQQGLLAKDRGDESLGILEVGFGTGLNALLTFLQARKNHFRIEYTALEPYPLAEEEFAALNFSRTLGMPALENNFLALHLAPWDGVQFISPEFSMRKIKATIQECSLPAAAFDLVYFDAFGPEVQPEMWTDEVFEKVSAAMKPGAILVTYSAKGSVRRSMKAAGLLVEKIPGPPGKREMTRAVKLAG